jgi:hypothetical protein
MAPKELWDRLDDETPAPWAAFQVFLHMSDRPRSLGKLVELRWEQAPAEGYAYHTLEHWSGQFEWFARAAEWDEHLERARRRGVTKVVEREGEKMAKDRIRLLGKARTILEAKLDSMINGGKVDVHDMNPHATIRLLREFNLLTRLEEGEATERVEEKSTDLSKLSDEQLAKLEELLAVARGQNP